MQEKQAGSKKRIKTEAMTVSPSELTPHPRNYRVHPDDQIAHVVQSIKEFGFYKNVVICRGKVILCGHGAVQAAVVAGLKSIPAVFLDIAPNSPQALKILAGDNETGKLAESNDRALTEILRDVLSQDDLLGTGYDEMMLANLVMVTRHANEIQDIDEAAHWVGLPSFELADKTATLSITFDNVKQRTAFLRSLGYKATDKTRAVKYEKFHQDDTSSVRFDL